MRFAISTFAPIDSPDETVTIGATISVFVPTAASAPGLPNSPTTAVPAALDKILLHNDEYKLVLPVGHPLAALDAVPVEALNDEPFLLLERGGETEVSDLLERCGVHPKVRFTMWEDFTIMAMAEKGMGVGILPDLILQRVAYRIEIRPLQTPYYRPIYLAMKNRARLTPAVQKFLDYLKFREAPDIK